jgi:DNA repair protein RecO (recombination protein O)
MLIHTRGIVFRTVKFGETSVIADIYTEDKGLHTFVAGGVRSARARMPFNLFQPMQVVDLVAYYREDPNAMNRLKELRAEVIFQRIPYDVSRGAVVLFLAEVCRKCIREAEENRPLFEFLLHQLIWLDSTEGSIANTPVAFLVQLCGFLGFQPEWPETDGPFFFDLREGLFHEGPPVHGAYLGPETTADLMAMMQATREESASHVLDRFQRKRLLQGLLQYYQWHVPGFEGIHTPEVMEWVWGG